VTNYVMLALGSPLHVFDFDTLHGGRIVVRRAKKGEELRTLDGTVRKLDRSDLLIADADRAIALAGIMGGADTEVSDTTTSVLLEAANFEPISLLKSSERLALRTEGSNRWEKGVDPHLAGPAATMATRLIVDLAAARWTGDTDVQATLPEPAVIQLRPERTNAVLGLDVPAGEQSEILVRRLVEDVLTGCGFSEAYTSTFVAEGDLRLPEPLSQEAAALRTALIGSLVDVARHNVAVGTSDVALFEIARTYHTGGELPDERWHVAGIVDGGFSEAKWAVEQLYDALKVRPEYERAAEPHLHPGKSARTKEGWVGELHPSLLEGTWGAFELDLDALVAAAPEAVEFEEVSPYPEVRQDLAFVVDDAVPAAELLAALREAGGPELRSSAVFDEYRGEQTGAGKRSLAFRVAFGSPERTLTDGEAAELRDRIVQALADKFGAVLRA
jgi:phenylalanyl-tRNA synthetase beta chain